MDCTPQPSRGLLRIITSVLVAAVFSWTHAPSASGQYSSAGIDLREHRSAQHSYAINENPPVTASHQQLRQFTPDGRDIQAIKKGRLNERDMEQISSPGYYGDSTGNTTRGGALGGGRQPSFIERERSNESGSKETAHELITRIGINLGFVLALAIGGILIYKQLQRGKPLAIGDHHHEMRVCQTLALTTGASIYVVEGFGKKFLVAIDGGGIKSVEVLNTSFRETLDHSEPEEPADLDFEEAVKSFAREQRMRDGSLRTKRSRRREQQEQMRREREEPTSELDSKLIDLLLKRTKQAA